MEKSGKKHFPLQSQYPRCTCQRLQLSPLVAVAVTWEFFKRKKDADDNKNTHARSVGIDSGSPTVAQLSPKITTRNGGQKSK